MSVRLRTFRPTRSGSRDTEASGQGLPLTRPLLQDLYHGHKAQFHTCPLVVGDRGNGFWWGQIGQQACGVQVTLHRPNPALARVPTLRQGLFHVALAVVTVLRQFGVIRLNAGQGAASFCNYASQMGYKQPWGTRSDTSAVHFLPAFEGGFLDLHVIAHAHQVIDQFAVQALAMRRQLAFLGGMAAACSLIAAAVVPVEATFAVLVNAAPLVVVVRVVGAALPLHLALQSALLADIWAQFLTELDQLCFPCTRHHRERRGTNIESKRVVTGLVLRLLVGRALYDQLHEITMALAVCPLCPGGRRLAAYQSRILQAVAQSIGDYRIVPINQCGDVILAPQETPNVAFL